MKKIKGLFIFLVTIFTLGGFSLWAVAQGEPPKVTVTVDKKIVSEGENFNVNFEVDYVENLQAYEIEWPFDANEVEVDPSLVEFGNIFDNENSIPTEPSEDTIANNLLLFGELIMGDVSKGGTLGTITLKPKKEGTFRIPVATALESGSPIVSLFNPEDSENTMNYIAEDVEVLFDFYAPTVEITNVLSIATNQPINPLTKETSVKVEGTYTETNIDKILINGVEAAVVPGEGNTGSYSAEITLAEGQNNISVEIVDKAGKKSEANWPTAIVVDTTAPELAINEPANALKTKNAKVTVSGTVADNSTVGLTVNGQAVEILDGNWSTEVDLLEGKNIIEVIATDELGNATVQNVEVTLDTKVDSFTVDQFETPTKEEEFTLTGTVEVGATVSGGQQTVQADQDGNWSLTLNLVEGTNEFTLTAKDEAGNEESKPVSIQLDTKVLPFDVTYNPIVTKNSDILEGLVEQGATVTVNGNPVQVDADGSWTFDVALDNEGENEITVIATDNLGNTDQKVITITRDTIVQPFTVNNDDITNEENYLLTGTVEAESNVTVNDNQAQVNPDGTWSVTVNLNEGDNPITVVATDKWQNSETKNIVIKLDTKVEPFSIDNYEAVTNEENFTLTGTVEAGSSITVGVETVQANQDGTWSITIELANGVNNLTVVAEDQLGNTATHEIVITLDTVVEPFTVAPYDAKTNQAVYTFTGTVELGSTIIIGEKAVQANQDGTWSITVDLAEGLNNLVATAVDSLGNSKSTNIAITLDTKLDNFSVGNYDAITNQNPYQFTGTAEVGSTVTVGDQTVQVNQNGEWIVNVNLIEGQNPLTIVATDEVGNNGSEEINIILDTKVEPFVINEYADITKEANVTLTGTVEVNSTVNVNGDEIQINADGTWSIDLDLVEGRNDFAIIATDQLGNSETKDINIALDAVLEPFDVDFADMFRTKQSSIDVKGPIEKGYLVSVNDQAATLTDNGQHNKYSKIIPLSLGENTITIFAQSELFDTNETITRIVYRDASGGGGGGSTPPPSNERKTDEKGGKLEFLGDKVALEVPADTFQGSVTLTVAVVNSSSVPQPSSELKRLSDVFEFKTSKGGEFDKPITMTLTYDPKQLGNLPESKLGIYYLNETTGKWEFVGGVVDPVKHTVSVQVRHFSKYTVMANGQIFDDTIGHWAKDSIEILRSMGIVNGYNASEFKPEKQVTRAEFTKMLVGALGLELKTSNQAKFKDVSPASWYYSYVETAATAGLAKGFNGNFEPQRSITREEAIAMVVRALRLEDEANKNLNGVLAFIDENTISDWAYGYLLVAVENDLVQGFEDHTVRPKEQIKRAEAATIMTRMLEKIKP